MKWRGSLPTGNALIGLALAALGAYVFATGQTMPMGTASLPGPGVLPTAVGVLLVLTGVIIAVVSWTRVRDAQGAETPETDLMPWNVLVGIAGLFFAAVLFEALGAPTVLAVMLALL